ncbi:unnamed protein product [Lactuca saligna]|uniref:Uncharacterized protein n=1 Tax=Lactuca saligna TaxID=75948 RepID=A0AA35ZVW6_LACSI|nr:unnamed protein product [Lactuca saligna]
MALQVGGFNLPGLPRLPDEIPTKVLCLTECLSWNLKSRLDNDELSPEQVNDVKDFIDDYVERNQEDFDEFEDVDMLYIQHLITRQSRSSRRSCYHESLGHVFVYHWSRVWVKGLVQCFSCVCSKGDQLIKSNLFNNSILLKQVTNQD